MSYYKIFAKVFPKRCNDLLKVIPVARWLDREVTLMLAVASAGLTIPIERLERKNYPYPFADHVLHPKAYNELTRILSAKFCGSVLLRTYPKSWCFGLLATTKGDPDTWRELHQPKPMPNDRTVREIIKHLRNALAHGSIHIKGDPISELVFIASVKYRSPDFNYLIVSPDDFLDFMKNWFEFLETLVF